MTITSLLFSDASVWHRLLVIRCGITTGSRVWIRMVEICLSVSIWSQQPLEIVVSRGQRITSAQNDLGDAAVPAYLPQSFLPLLLARRVGRVVKVSPEAITAVYCTMRRGSKQDTTRYFCSSPCA